MFIGLTVLASASASAWAQDQGDVGVDASTTGDRSELIKTIPIEPDPGRGHVALALRPKAMPQLERGDRIRVSSELLVTTDCTFSSPRCAGSPYTFNPRAEASLVLVAGNDEATLATQERRCWQKPGERQHHCLLTFTGVEAGQSADRLRCEAARCALEVRVRAWSSQANGSQRLVIGSNKPNGRIVQDKARLNAIRIRPGGGRLPKPTTAGPAERSIPQTLKRTVIYSQRLEVLTKGEVIEASLDARASVEGLGYSSLVGSQIVLSESADGTHGGALVKRVASLGGEITEISGTNCTQSQSPCPIVRTGILKLREDARKRSGRRVPLFVNVVARSKPKHASARPGDAVRIIDRGGLRVRRYGGS